LRFYVDASLHVAAAIAALAILSRLFFGFQIETAVTAFIFLSSIVAYNLAKYSEVNPNGLVPPVIYLESRKRQLIAIISCLAAGCSLWLSLQLSAGQLFFAGLSVVLTIFYVMPAFRGYSLRNLPRLKVFVIALSWVMVTVGIPLSGENILVSWPVLAHATVIFLCVLALMIPFEIRDTLVDAPGLQTLPQLLGVRKVRHLAGLFALLMVILTAFNPAFDAPAKWSAAGIALLITGLGYGARPHQSFWYAAFWVESVPLFWLLLYLLLLQF
jgi:hypothetical protein